jgi:hypothetical protein
MDGYTLRHLRLCKDMSGFRVQAFSRFGPVTAFEVTRVWNIPFHNLLGCQAEEQA